MIVKHRIQLVELLKELNILGPAAEIGVAEGNFSRDLLVAGIPFLYMVDNWGTIENIRGDGNSPQDWHNANYDKALLQTQTFAHRIEILRGKSVEMASRVPDESLSLVYLDADHSFEGVLSDLRAWFPKLVKGGVMAGHDFLQPEYGVKQAVNDFVFQVGPPFSNIYTIPENKTEDAGFYFIKQ